MCSSDLKFTKRVLKRLEDDKIESIDVLLEDLVGKVLAHDIVDKATGEVIVECNAEITEENLEALRKAGVSEFKVLYIDNLNVGGYIRNTILIDKVNSTEEAMIEIYKRLRPGDPPTLEASQALFENLFFNPDRYDLSQVGRLKINHKFGFDVPLDQRTLRKEDILHFTK